jgi:hypothetical protein
MSDQRSVIGLDFWSHGDRCRTVWDKFDRYGTIVVTVDGVKAVIWDDQITDEDTIDETGMTYGGEAGFVGPIPKVRE